MFGLCRKFLKVLLHFPSWPQHLIEHVAFQPPSPTYVLHYNEDCKTYVFEVVKGYDIICQVSKGDLPIELICDFHTLPLNQIQLEFVPTKSSTKIVCAYYATQPPTKTTILYSHGNACDLGTVIPLCIWLADLIHCNILAYDYSGYGQSSGKPSEKQAYTDIEVAYNHLLKKYNCSPQDIVLMGVSLGSAPTLHLATRTTVRGVVLQSAFASALNIVFPQEGHMPLCCDKFQNILKIVKLTSPLLVIHGTNDKLISKSHGEALYMSSPLKVEPLWLKGAGHNNIELHREFLDRLDQFVNNESLGFQGFKDPIKVNIRVS